MKTKEIDEYLSLLDFSLITDKYSLMNVYEEIGMHGSYLALSPNNSTNLERLVLMSDAESLLKFYKTLDSKLIYKKLGSRIIESIFSRLFECMYLLNEDFWFEDLIEGISFEACLRNKNATHVLRHIFMLLSGKKVDKFVVKKYEIREKKNFEYGTRKLQDYKQIFMKFIKEFNEIDTFITFGIFIQITKSQSLIKEFFSSNLSFENLKKYEYLYEILIKVANRSNLADFYEKIKNKISDSEFMNENSYCMQAFIRKYKKPDSIYKKIVFTDYETNSNIILVLLESLQENKFYNEVVRIIADFYNITQNLFHTFLLSKDQGLDTKYVKAVANFMKMPTKFSYNTNEDFIKYYNHSWLSTKSGIELIIAFSEGSASSHIKKTFFNANINKLRDCKYWKNGKSFIKRVTNYTEGYARKKAFNILNEF